MQNDERGVKMDGKATGNSVYPKIILVIYFIRRMKMYIRGWMNFKQS
jgi:hypothetical protein